MHLQQARFVMALREAMPSLFVNSTVLEIGSYNVNGSIRQYFETPKRYIGVDLIEGPGVDIVSNGAAVSFHEYFDLVISTECFEHAPNFCDIFENMIANSDPTDGVVAFTCATTGRVEHGTRRTTPGDSPGTIGIGQDHYRNVVKEDFSKHILGLYFTAWQFFRNDETHDLYFVGFRKCPKHLATNAFDLIEKSSGAVRV